jgi:hypothetical protein
MPSPVPSLVLAARVGLGGRCLYWLVATAQAAGGSLTLSRQRGRNWLPAMMFGHQPLAAQARLGAEIMHVEYVDLIVELVAVTASDDTCRYETESGRGWGITSQPSRFALHLSRKLQCQPVLTRYGRRPKIVEMLPRTAFRPRRPLNSAHSS